MDGERATTTRPSPAAESGWLEVRLDGLRRDAHAWLRLRGPELWLLVGVWSVVSVAIFWLSTGHQSPRRYQDEFLFWSLAEAFAGGDGLTWRGEGIGLYYFLYPVLLAPAFWIGDSIPVSYTLVHLFNSLMIVGVVFPAYLMARLFVRRGAAMLAAMLALSVPAMNYAGVIGTESLGYPVCAAAFAAMILSIARPRRRNWMLALATIPIAVVTRAQFSLLAPIYFVSVVLAGLMLARAARGEYFRVQREPLALMVGGFVLLALVFLIKGRSVVGLYQGIFEGVSPTFEDIAYWVKALTADIYLVTAIIPAIATVAMVFQRGSRRDPLVGALLAVTLTATIAFIAQVGWFSAINPYNWRTRNIFYERYMFYLVPLFFTGMVVAWKRVTVGPAIASSVLAVVVMTGFQTDAVMIPFSYDSFGLSLVGAYLDAHPDAVPDIGRLLAGLTAAMAVAYVISRIARSTIARLFGVACFTVVFAALLVGQGWTWHFALTYSAAAFESVPKPVNFVDRNTDQDVGMIVTSTDSPDAYFTTEFWNDRIVRTFATEADPIKTPIMYSPRCDFDWEKSGEILGTGCDKVPAAYFLRNDTLSMHLKDERLRVHPTGKQPNLTLMVGVPPARLLSMVEGRNVFSGEVQTLMNVWTFLDRPGELRVRFAERDTELIVNTTRGDRMFIPGGRSMWLVSRIPAGEATTGVRPRTTAGVPEVAIVKDVQVREPGGRWVSIR